MATAHFGVSVEYVNRNDRGFVDFEKMIGLDGIALINVVADPEMATITGTKQLQSRITHNDGELASIYIFSCGKLNTHQVARGNR